MWFKLAMLVDGKTEPQREMACSGSQRKPGEVLGASPQPDPPIPRLGVVTVLLLCPFSFAPSPYFFLKERILFL